MTLKLAIVPVSEDASEGAGACETAGPPAAQNDADAVLTMDELREENRRLRSQLAGRAMREIVGQSPAASQLKEHIARANNELPVLIQGEPGSGAESVAQAIHTCGRRAHRSFIKIDCLLLTAEQLEQELSNAERSAPTDSTSASSTEPRRLQLALGGTLFLKNVDAVPPALQRKLAQVIRRLGDDSSATGESRTAGARVLASTTADLERLVEQQRFREDLLAELSAHTIVVPSLRERIPDVGLLAEHFISRAAVSEGRPSKRLTVDAVKLLQSHHWPGNVAELCNVIERACSIDQEELLTADLVRPWIAGRLDHCPQDRPALTLKEMERKLIETTFSRCEGNRELTAQELQIGLRTLSGKLREYGYPPRGGPNSKLQTPKLKAA